MTGINDLSCRGCGGPIDAIPGYESRTLYCSRRCEDRAFRRRQREQRERLWAIEAEAERLGSKKRDALAEAMCRHTFISDWYEKADEVIADLHSAGWRLIHVADAARPAPADRDLGPDMTPPPEGTTEDQ